MIIKIMTWNICTGEKWKDIAEFVKYRRIEIVGFQEVDNNFRETTKSLDVCKAIADKPRFLLRICTKH